MLINKVLWSFVYMASLQKRIVKGREYWSIVESKRINGKPRPVIVEYIGNTKKLFERIQDNSIKDSSLKSYSHGDTYALMAIAKKLEIEKTLDAFFKKQTMGGVKRSTSLLLAAIQSACSPGSKSDFVEWFKATTLPHELGIKSEALSSQHFWRQMDNISKEELMLAEDAITKKILEIYNIGLDKLALDYTNYFTYISTSNEKSNIAKRGRNKQKRHDLKQCSLALVTSKETGIPLFSHVYEGNKNDQTGFSEYLPLLESRIPEYDPNEITLIFDGGSVSKKNLATLKTHYICSFPINYCKKLYDIDIEDYTGLKINNRTVLCHRTTESIWDEERVCVLTFSNKLYDGQLKELNENIAKATNALAELNDKINDSKSRIDKSEKALGKKIEGILKNKYISDIIHAKTKNNNVVYDINASKKLEITTRYFGKKLTITDRDTWTTSEIIRTYYEQDHIEKLFRDTKNVEHFSVRPLFHWTEQKIRVHIFTSLLGLTLTSILQRELHNKGFKLSKDKILDNLNKVRQCWVISGSGNKVVKVIEEIDGFLPNLWNAVCDM